MGESSSVPAGVEQGGVIVRSFRGHPSALYKIRTFVRDLATEQGVPEPVVDDLVLAVSEASANAMLHTNSPRIEVAFRASTSSVEVQVQDDGVFHRRLPIPELDGHGRGIPLMMALMDEVAIREGTPARPGTSVRLVKHREPASS
ncbi:MAG TPA: ATP-binding protein [Actinomycetota bacterium]|nr:ATP-binding protein [Actinomycetota bacterium]